MKKMILFIAAFAGWILLAWPPDGQHAIAGVFVAALIVLVIGDLFISRPGILKHPLRYWRFFFHYLPMFLWECCKANIDVAYRVLHPKLPIKPGIVKVRTALKSDIALTFLANSITLTPGTLTVDIDREKGILYIHWIDVKDRDIEAATKIVAERFERILKKIFD